MTTEEHIALRDADAAMLEGVLGTAYSLVCVASELSGVRPSYTMWKAPLVGEMKGYTFYVHVRDGKISSSSVS